MGSGARLIAMQGAIIRAGRHTETEWQLLQSGLHCLFAAVQVNDVNVCPNMRLAVFYGSTIPVNLVLHWGYYTMKYFTALSLMLCKQGKKITAKH